ncbi:ATP-binding cassette domain-containing protein, partial [Cobetia marina]
MTAIVNMQKINKHFGSLHVLKDIDLEVAQGEVVVIIGASGSGKSTLIRCVNGLEEFQGGSIEVDGQSLIPHGKSHRALKTIRTEVGMVFQQFNLFPHMKVRDNVSLAPIKVRGSDRATAERQADTLLERVN